MKETHSQSVPSHAGASQVSRRQFVRAGAIGAAAMSFPFVGNVLGANDRINMACIGVKGKGETDTDDSVACGANIVALCDVSSRNLDEKKQKFPKAETFADYRKCLEKMGSSIDAVTVSTPDHCHAVVSAMAMRMGKHVYCQKPLTQTIWEARELRDLAAKTKVATQMGNQGSALDSLRRAVEVVQAGIIGHVSELHVWTDRPYWPNGLDRPPGSDPVPDWLNWDLWIGPAPMRPYKNDADGTPLYLPLKWRGWYDFGAGALGDMACHTVNMPFRALKLGYPTVVECEEASALHPETFPKTSRIRFEYPERQGMVPLKFWWYDGNPVDKTVTPLRPPPELTREIVEMYEKLPKSGCLLVGDKGKLFSGNDYGAQSMLLLPGEKSYTSMEKHEAVQAVPQTIPRCPGTDKQRGRHNEEWFRMMRTGTPSYSNFAIASELTESILLGCVALRVGVGRKMEWDAKHVKSPNCPEAAQYLQRHNRHGWKA